MLVSGRSFISELKEFFLGIWNTLKKIWVVIVNFIKNILNWFKGKYSLVLSKLKRKSPTPNKPISNERVKMISLKIQENLQDKSKYNKIDMGIKPSVVNTFFDTETGEILEEDTEVIEYEKLDAQTKNAFGNKEMIELS